MSYASSDVYLSIEPVNRKLYGLGVKSVKPQFSAFFNVDTDEDPIRNSVAYGGSGTLRQKNEMAAIESMDLHQADNKQWRASTWAGGYALSKEMIMDSRLREIKGAAAMLGAATRQTPEYIISTFIGRGFNTAYPATWDGLPIWSASHLLPNRTTAVSNLLNGNPAMSETSIEAAMIMGMNMKGENGLLAPVEVEAVVAPAGLLPTAHKLADTKTQYGSANNTVSYINGKFKVLPFTYQVSQTAWFTVNKNLPTVADGFFWDWRMKPEFIDDAVPGTFSKNYFAVFRARHGIEDFRGTFGSNYA